MELDRTTLRFKDGTDPGKGPGALPRDMSPAERVEYTTETEPAWGDDAQLVSSAVDDTAGQTLHYVAIDVDMPCHLVESSPGRNHLFIDKGMAWPEYRRLLVALEAAGIIEKGYLEASLVREFTCLRIHPTTPRAVTVPDIPGTDAF